MSLEADMVQAASELVDGAKEQITFLAQITSDTPLEAKVDGSSIAIPCIRTDGTEMTIGKQVVLLKVGPKFYVVGALGTYVAPVIPEVPVTVTNLLTTTTAYLTTNTLILTSTAVPEGTYKFRVFAQWDKGVANFDHFCTVAFTGTASDGNYALMRYVSNANAGSFANALGAEVNLGQNDDSQALIADGFVTVTAPGTLTLSFRRASGSDSGSVIKGASIQMFPVT